MPSVARKITVRPFAQSEWREYRDTRLQALRDSPDAFGSVYETTSLLPDNEWIDRLARISPQKDLPLAGLVESEFSAMAWARFDESEEKVAHLYQMWVSPRFRGNGLARKLLYTAMQWATSLGASAMILGVTCGDTPARKLYNSAGFEPIGIPEPLRPGSKLEVQTMKFVFTKAGI